MTAPRELLTTARDDRPLPARPTATLAPTARRRAVSRAHRRARRAELERLLPRHGRHPARSTRRRPTCSGRASSRCGRRASARRPPRSARPAPPAPQDHLFPSYREHVVGTIRGVDPVDIIRVMRGSPTAAGTRRPEERQHPPLHARARLADAARDRLAMGLAVRRRLRHRRPRARRGRASSTTATAPSSQGDVHEAMVFAASYRTPAGVLPAEQPVGDLGAGRDAVARRRCTAAARGYGMPEHPDRRQRRARQLRRHPRRTRRGARRRRPARDRGDDLPHGRAHHQRRPDEVPHLRRGGVVGAARPDRPHARVPARPRARPTRSSPTSTPRRADVADDIRVRTLRARRLPHRR